MSEPTGFDISTAPDLQQAEDDGQWVEIFDVEGEPLDGFAVLVAGSYSTRYRKEFNRQSQEAVKHGRRRKFSAEEARKQLLELHAACVIDWRGLLDAGKPVECTRERVVALLKAHPWIFDQVSAAIEDHAGFFRQSSKG